MTRERRVSPAVSSRSASRVRSTSWKPNAVRRSSAAAAVSGPDARERVEQRREEQLLVDRRAPTPVARGAAVERLDCGLVRLCRGIRAPREVGRARRVGRQCVGLLLVDELQSVLDRPQPDVCVHRAPARRAW